MSELRLKVKPKPGDREPTEEDYESSEEKTDDGEFNARKMGFHENYNSLQSSISADDRSVAYQVPTKDISGGR